MANIEKLGSSSPEVLLKNATNLDKLVNGRESESLPDRFGVLRKTWHGMEMIFSRFIDYITGRGEQAVAAIGWQELGNWAVGLAVDNRQQIVYYNGSWYKYLGELEHVIAGDSPEGTVAKLAMRQPFVLFKGLTFQKLCLPGAFRPGDHHN
ncbi:hypothetical protein VVZ41_18615, partial [Klebsiella pneumoniae]